MITDIDTARKLAVAHCASWTSLSADKVAERYSESTSFGMNGGEPMTTRAKTVDMASGFMVDLPDLVLFSNTALVADHHMVYAWTIAGHHAQTGRLVRFNGWEEWDLNDNPNDTVGCLQSGAHPLTGLTDAPIFNPELRCGRFNV